MRHTLKILAVVVILAGAVSLCAQNMTNPISQIRWNVMTGNGGPELTITCQGTTPPPPNSAAPGQFYFDNTPPNSMSECLNVSGVFRWVKNPVLTQFGSAPPVIACSGSINGTVFVNRTPPLTYYICDSTNNVWLGPFNSAGPVGPVGPPVIFDGPWSAVVTVQQNHAVSFGGSSFVALVTNTGIQPPLTCTSTATWGIQACGSGMPTLTNKGQSGVYSDLGPVAGNPIANGITPDALVQPITEYAGQTAAIGAIAAVADTKPILANMNTSLLALQTACEGAGICFPNPLANVIATTSGAVFILFNPTSSPSPALSVNAVVGTDTWTAVPSTGAPNALVGGAGQLQGGWVAQGPCGIAGNVIPSGAAITTATTSLNGGVMAMSTCAGFVTSPARVQGGGTLTSAAYPALTNTLGTHITMFPAGGTLCWWGMPTIYTTSAGTVQGTLFQGLATKNSEWQIGPGYGAIFNGTAFQTYTFPNNTPANQNFFTGLGGSNHYLVPEADYQMCLVYNPAAGSFGAFTVYMNDGQGTFASPQVNLTSALAATSVTKPSLNVSFAGRHEALLYLPGVFLTQAQVAGMYHGFTSVPNTNPYSASHNGGPSFNQAPAVQWNPYTVKQSMTQDCPFFTPYTNGGNSTASIGTMFYNATFSMCHLKFQTSAPYLRVTSNPGIPNQGGDMSVRIDGVLQTFENVQTASNVWTMVITPGTTNVNHTYDVNYGMSTGNNVAGFSPPQLYSGLGGFFPRNIEVPNPYTVTTVAETGTVAFCVTDSIVCTGTELTGDGTSFGTFLPINRYSTGTTSFGTANIAALGFGSALLSTDFNNYPTPLSSGSVPTAAAAAFVSGNANIVTNGTPANATVNIVARGINDITHGTSVWGGTANCTQIFAFTLRNELAAWAAYNPAIKHYVFSPINATAYSESTTLDGCTGNSYTMVNTVTAQQFSAGAWSGVPITAGTVLTGSAGVWVYRAIEQDVCASVSNCTYVELGPGAPTLTGGYQMPNLQQVVGQCYSTVQVCYFNDNLHLTAYGHWLLARYINAQPWATSQALKEFAMNWLEDARRARGE